MPHATATGNTTPCQGDVVSFAFESPYKYDQNKPLYIEGDDLSRSLSATQLKTLTAKLIAGFKHVGIKQGDRIAVHLPNTCLYTPIFFGIVGAGAVYVPSNPAYKQVDLEHLLNLARPALIITIPEMLPLITESVRSCSIPESAVYTLDLSGFDISKHTTLSNNVPIHTTPQTIESLLSHGTSDWRRLTTDEESSNTLAAMFTTSGTTGLPKLAALSHKALITSTNTMVLPVPYNPVRIIALPFFLPYGFYFGHCPAVLRGEPLYILPRLHPIQYVQAIQKFKITDAFMVPAIVHVLLQSGLPLKEMFDSLRFAGVGGGQLTPALRSALTQHLHADATIAHGWGLTETGVMTSFLYGNHDDTGSIGRLAKGCDIKLVDDHGKAINQADVAGTAWVRGPAMLNHYVTSGMRPTPAVDPEGWFDTGDVISRKGDKYYIVGRSKELIKVKGWPVSPTEIESVLMTHPLVADCAVYAVSTPSPVAKAGSSHLTESSEYPRALVMLKPNTPDSKNTSERDIYDFVHGKLARYKALDGGVKFVAAPLPRNAMGKIMRFKLKDLDI